MISEIKIYKRSCVHCHITYLAHHPQLIGVFVGGFLATYIEGTLAVTHMRVLFVAVCVLALTHAARAQYHTTDNLLEKIQETVQHCTAATAVYHDADIESGELPYLHIEGSRNPEQVMMVQFGQHARELITAEVGLHLVQGLCEGTVPVPPYSLLIVPVGNVRGRRVVDRGHQCHRGSVNGVDLNRNFPTHWGVAGNNSADVFPGAQPWSEAESRAFRDIVEGLAAPPLAFVNVHSGTRAMYTPSDCMRAPPADYDRLMRAVMPVNTRHCSCTTGIGSHLSGYRACGTTSDWMYEEVGARYSYTFEVFDKNAAGQGGRGCRSFFNPLTQSGYHDTVQRWTEALMTLNRQIFRLEGAKKD